METTLRRAARAALAAAALVTMLSAAMAFAHALAWFEAVPVEVEGAGTAAFGAIDR